MDIFTKYKRDSSRRPNKKGPEWGQFVYELKRWICSFNRSFCFLRSEIYKSSVLGDRSASSIFEDNASCFFFNSWTWVRTLIVDLLECCSHSAPQIFKSVTLQVQNPIKIIMKNLNSLCGCTPIGHSVTMTQDINHLPSIVFLRIIMAFAIVHKNRRH